MNETLERMRRIEEQIRSLIEELDWPEETAAEIPEGMVIMATPRNQDEEVQP